MAKSLRDLFLDKDYQVPIVEKPAKQENIVNSELNKNRPLLQFVRNLPRVYGTDLIRIESRGSIDPARTLAVRSARPAKANGSGGGFGRFLSNLLGQNGAYRPSDTIFPADGMSPPVSKNGQPINQDWSGLRNAVEEDTNYVDIAKQALFFKQPGNNPLTGLLRGNSAKEIGQEAVGRAIGAAQNLVTKGLTSALTSKRKKNRGTGNDSLEEAVKQLTFDDSLNGGAHFKTKDQLGTEVLESFRKAKIPKLDYFNQKLLQSVTKTDKELETLVERNTQNVFQYFLIKRGVDGNLLFPAAIESVSETVNPEWTDFRYVGSPFKVYRYVGVEREVRIDFKVYYFGSVGDRLANGVMLSQQSAIMKAKINELRKLVYPDEKIITVDLGDKNYSPLAFRPTIVSFSLGQYYQNIQAIVSSLDISVPKEVSWAHSNPTYDGTIQRPIIYPTVVDISIGFKIIENSSISDNNGQKTITYRLDDMTQPNGNTNASANEPSTETIKTERTSPTIPNAPNTLPANLRPTDIKPKPPSAYQGSDAGESTYSMKAGFIGDTEATITKTFKIGGVEVSEEVYNETLKRDGLERRF